MLSTTFVVMYIWLGSRTYNGPTPQVILGFNSIAACERQIPKVKEDILSAYGNNSRSSYFAFSAKCGELKRD